MRYLTEIRVKVTNFLPANLFNLTIQYRIFYHL